MSYQVIFYREVVNSYGKPSKTSLYTTEIEARGSMDEAIAAAIAAFKRDRGVPCWRDLADGYEVSYEARNLPPRDLPPRDLPPGIPRSLTGRRFEHACAGLREE